MLLKRQEKWLGGLVGKQKELLGRVKGSGCEDKKNRREGERLEGVSALQAGIRGYMAVREGRS